MKYIFVQLLLCFFFGKANSQVLLDTIRIPPMDKVIGKHSLDSTLKYYISVIDDIIPNDENDEYARRSNCSKNYQSDVSFVISEMVRITGIKAIDTLEEGQYGGSIVIDASIAKRWKSWIRKNYDRLRWDWIRGLVIVK